MSLIRLASNNVSNCSDGGTKDENSVLFSGNSNPNRRRSISSIVSAALRPRKLIDEPSEVSTGRSGVQYDTAAVANPKSNSSINEVHKSPADELQQKPTIERLKDRIGRGGAQVDENQGTIVAGSSNVSTPHAPVPNKLTTRQPTSSFILPPVPLDEIISSIDVTQGSTDYVIKSLEGLKESVANLLDWKNRLLASEAMPITALVPMTIAVSQIMRRQETHKDSMLLLLDEVQMLPSFLLSMPPNFVRLCFNPPKQLMMRDD